MKIYLIGMPGAGKSTLGQQLARELKCDFFDLDELLVRDEKSEIKKIFEEKEEKYFRIIESEMLKKVISQNDHFVMATGGGTPCYENNMQLLKASGVVIFIDVPLETLVKRTQAQELERPLLGNRETLRSRLKEIMSDRIHVFREADLIVTGTAIELDQILSALKNRN